MSVDIGEIFPILLATKPAVVALAAARFFPNRVPQRETKPAVVWQRTGGNPVAALEEDTDVSWATFKLGGWSSVSQEEARQLCSAAQTIKCAAVRIGDWWVQSWRVVPGSDSDEPLTPQDGSDNPEFVSSVEMTVFYMRGANS